VFPPSSSICVGGESIVFWVSIASVLQYLLVFVFMMSLLSLSAIILGYGVLILCCWLLC